MIVIYYLKHLVFLGIVVQTENHRNQKKYNDNLFNLVIDYQ